MRAFWTGLSVVALLSVGGCKKGDDKAKKDDKAAESANAEKSAEKPADPGAAPAADEKPDDALCEKVVAKQLELETDPQMKSTMEMSKADLKNACTTGIKKHQAECIAGAADKNAFANCLLK